MRSETREDGSAPPGAAQPCRPRPAMASLLTVVLTTSPTPSAPSTDLVGAVLASFETHCPALLQCSVVVVFDTYDRVGPQLRLKKGTVTAVEAAHYDTYKANVRQLVLETWGRHAGLSASDSSDPGIDCVEDGAAEFGSPFLRDNSVPFRLTHMRTPGRLPRISFVEPAARLGFGLGVRTAIRAATTPYVWVQQHDWSLSADIPVAAMLDVMQDSESDDAASTASGTPPSDLGLGVVPVRYICLPSVRMLRYATSAHATEFPVLRAITSAFQQSFRARRESRADTDTDTDTDTVPLTPLFFWHDKTHIASRTHYLQSIFPSRLALGRGDFIEDHIGQRARSQMKEDAAAWKRWATWQYYPDGGNELCLRHLQGRTWRGEEQEQAMREQYMARNRAEAAEAAAAADQETPVPPRDSALTGIEHGWAVDMPFGSDE